MAKRTPPRPRLLDVALTAILSLFLAAVVLIAAGAGAFLPEGQGAVGPAGRWLGEWVIGAIGPWLMWLLPIVPWAWIPIRRSRARRILVSRAAWVVGACTVSAALLAHDQLGRLGVPANAGGAFGDLVEGALSAVIGPLGSFLLLASLVTFLLLKPLPPIHVSLPALDPLTAAAGAVFAASGRVARAGLERLCVLASWISTRWDDAREAWKVEREEARRLDAAPSQRAAVVPTGWVDEAAIAAAESGHDEASDEGEDDEYEYEYEYEDGDDDDEEEYEEDLDEELAAEPPVTTTEARVVESESEAELRWSAGVAAGEFRLSRDPSELLADDALPSAPAKRRRRSGFPLPPLETLDEIEKEQRGFSREALQMNARLLMETLGNFGIEGQINEIRPGPVVTTFEFEPAPGVKVSQIVSRGDDLALAMRAMRIRIEAPIPGKAAVGIEIPNPYPQTVGLRQVIGAITEEPADAPLAIAFGKDTEGEPFVADLADMPHLLVAGATGSGKSVCINAIICNLLLRNGPDRVRMLMIDPKMLELSVYNGIPHLMHPVITQAGDALKAVKYMVAEMETRYGKLARHGVRNIKDFNQKIREGRAVDDKTGEKLRDELPYCVFIIDELADLMMQLGNDLELPIARLAQMARAVGIHLVLATQRPSVNVITGVIKANFPSRIGFRVISKIDSRTILDASGAEALLGKGDMLFLLAGRAQPVRVHGAYLSMEECERVVEHWLKYRDEEPDHIDLDGGNGLGGGIDLGEDELLAQARAMVVSTQMGSTTMLQRRLRIGYTRAARLMDMLEVAGVVGPFEGSKARKVLVGKDELEGES
jgi:DNA segregation ATPase FtsK/SpoIIIE-like protein